MEMKAAATAEAAAKVAAAEARKWEECVDEGEAFVTAMLASVVRSLAEGPKTEFELDQVGVISRACPFVFKSLIVVRCQLCRNVACGGFLLW